MIMAIRDVDIRVLKVGSSENVHVPGYQSNAGKEKAINMYPKFRVPMKYIVSGTGYQ